LQLLADLQNILKKSLVTKISKSSNKLYIIVVRNQNNILIFTFFALKTDNSLFCHRDIPTIHNSYCVSNAIDYATIYQRLCQLSHLN